MSEQELGQGFMNCQACHSREATVLYTHIIESDKSSWHFCAPCAAQKCTEGDSLAPHQELGQALDVGAQESGVRDAPQESGCPVCGTTYGEIKQVGRLGCPHCYEVFGDRVGQLLKQIHGSLEHRGKRQMHKDLEEVEQLRQQLAEAVALEAFEKAAQLRDRIVRLEGEAD
ncbi:MAG: hypothetical protein GKR89_23035 [Candidatus Latescibacteria bacterium]|nr:hypothetical protein [Candidatus Latescibacterota bacterium]